MRLLILVLLALLLGSPAIAQDATPAVVVIPPDATVADDPTGNVPVVVVTPPAPSGVPESVQVALVVAVAGVIGVALIAYAHSKETTPRAVYWSLPPAVTGYGVPLAWEAAMRHARTTVSTADDEALVAIAETLGYVVTELPDGRLVLSKAPDGTE